MAIDDGVLTSCGVWTAIIRATIAARKIVAVVIVLMRIAARNNAVFEAIMNMREKLVSAVTAWDRKQSTKRFYNPHGLGIMLTVVELVADDIDAGADPRRAIMAGFNDRLLDHVLRSVGLQTATTQEHHSLPMTYQSIANSKG